MAKSKKVILFIVEGITEETSFSKILNDLNKNDKILFKIVNGDLTSEFFNNSTNILNKVNEQVKDFIRKYYLKKSDIKKIIHLVDTDGAFIPSEKIIYDENIKDFYDENIKVFYEENCIRTINVELIKNRNLNKSNILNRLCTTKQINNVLYEVYYFSSNLEHVLHNNQNVINNKDKIKLAEKFQDEYYEKTENFVTFIKDNEFSTKGSYKETWEFIKKDCNSLKRYTNFNLLIDNIVNELI